MIPLPLGRIAEITSGALMGMADPHTVVRGPVVIDSRAVEPGSLFVAIKGARVDGHDFAAAAVEAGATAVLATRPTEAPTVIVSDVQAALAALAQAVHAELPSATVIGITGSAGKTTTKDLLAGLTALIGPTVAPVGSYNNEIGHPLTVLKADESTRFLVLELSARRAGHIAYLARIAPPRIGVVLNVGTAHLGVFGGREAIAKAKGELVEALPSDGVAVLNADDPHVRAMASRTSARVTWFGRSPDAAVRAEDVTVDERGRARYVLRTPSGDAEVALRLYGEHAVENSLAAAAGGYELGLPVATIARALSEAEPRSRWRMEVTDRPDGVTVINDAYNANPDSMRAAFVALGDLGRNRRRFAVIAALRELGEESAALNEQVGRLAGGAGLAGLVVVGPDAEPILAGAAGAPILHVPDAETAAAELGPRLAPGDVVLIKGPRAMGLERVAELLLAAPGQGPQPYPPAPGPGPQPYHQGPQPYAPGPGQGAQPYAPGPAAGPGAPGRAGPPRPGPAQGGVPYGGPAHPGPPQGPPGPHGRPAPGPAQGPAQGPTQGPIQGPAQGRAQGPAQGQARGLAHGPAQIPPHGAARGPVQGPAQGQVPGSAQRPVQGPVQGPVQAPVQGPVHGPVQGPPQGPAPYGPAAHGGPAPAAPPGYVPEGHLPNPVPQPAPQPGPGAVPPPGATKRTSGAPRQAVTRRPSGGGALPGSVERDGR
ncbi:UDP-N-acetylmuramoyl-tripeptide--D-alanyl-D-alanine ligase [Thermocatellispora tengchongensis]|uniref:UDP-N-acetylmuramoyl-tripeptide--D-alanyl-D-alanine ligase n=1 Tax=Thermocatellispora tengchongensis TaxID=1073253 RepID=A0A840NW08_9ACTN|nr:UDP-N-acetylmuramoyl-tripeptide--D-alanyl-D-alanine ligase [Thermocatellispora tengchongensis]